MDAGRKPDALQIDRHGLKKRALPVANKILIQRFEHTANPQIIAPVLVKKNVAPVEGGFLQIVYIGLFLQRKFFKSFHLIAQHLDVGKLLVSVFEGMHSLHSFAGIVLFHLFDFCCLRFYLLF